MYSSCQFVGFLNSYVWSFDRWSTSRDQFVDISGTVDYIVFLISAVRQMRFLSDLECGKWEWDALRTEVKLHLLLEGKRPDFFALIYRDARYLVMTWKLRQFFLHNIAIQRIFLNGCFYIGWHFLVGHGRFTPFTSLCNCALAIGIQVSRQKMVVVNIVA